jgi:hypothetical protein
MKTDQGERLPTRFPRFFQRFAFIMAECSALCCGVTFAHRARASSEAGLFFMPAS